MGGEGERRRGCQHGVVSPGCLLCGHNRSRNHAIETLAQIAKHAQAWQADARLLGNIRAEDIFDACAFAMIKLRYMKDV